MVAHAVFSIRYPVFRQAVAITGSQRLRGVRPMEIGKHMWFLLGFLNAEYWTLNTARARSLGTHGVIYPIEEQDPIALIQQKLKVMEDNGELEQRNLELQKKARASVERPKVVEGITKSTKGRVFFYDPTYEVKADLKDHQGQIFAKKGTKFNPLETVSLSTNLIFFNGDDSEQLAWAKEQLKEGSVKLILVKGAPLQLAEDLNIPVYFDQGGILTKKLGIKNTPAFVSQENLHLKIEEIKLPLSRELNLEGDL